MMKISNIVSLMIVLLGITSVCNATDWQEYFHAANGSRFFIDANSIVPIPDGRVRAWEKFQSANGKGNLNLIEVACKMRMFTIRVMKPLNPNDIEGLKDFEKMTRTWTEPTQQWKYIDTTEIQEAMYDRWCDETESK